MRYSLLALLALASCVPHDTSTSTTIIEPGPTSIIRSSTVTHTVIEETSNTSGSSVNIVGQQCPPTPSSVTGCYVTDRVSHQAWRASTCNARWEATDLPIMINAPLELQADVAFAADYINSYAGVEIFTTDPDRAGFNLGVTQNDFGGGAFLGYASWNWAGFTMNAASVQLWSGFPAGPSHDRRYVAVHELLHVLGFSHDMTGCSILVPAFRGDCLMIADRDVQALKQLYGHTGVLLATHPVGESGPTIITEIEGHQCGVNP